MTTATLGVMSSPIGATAKGTFDIEMTPPTADLGGSVKRIGFSKAFHGDLVGTGFGVMLTCGDPQSGEAGYVAIETFHGRLGEREGRFALQQFATMHAGSQTLHYEVVPGSGEADLDGISGVFHLTVDTDGTHRYELVYEL